MLCGCNDSTSAAFNFTALDCKLAGVAGDVGNFRLGDSAYSRRLRVSALEPGASAPLWHPALESALEPALEPTLEPALDLLWTSCGTRIARCRYIRSRPFGQWWRAGNGLAALIV